MSKKAQEQAKEINFIDTGSAVTLIANGKSFTIAASHPNYNGILDALNAKDWNKAQDLADLATAVRNYVSTASSDVEVNNGGVYYKGEKLGGVVVNKILRFLDEGKPTEPLIRFVERLMANPSFNSRQRLYEFLENHEVPITNNGTFLAYKAVQSNYLSKTSGKENVEISADGGKTWEIHKGFIPNNVGNIIKMERSSVDDNPDNHCSAGVHCGGLEYVNWFGNSSDKKIIVEVDPADVVSVPNDHNAGKIRTSQYKVVCDFKGEFRTALEDVDNLYSDVDDDDYDPYYDDDGDDY